MATKKAAKKAAKAVEKDPKEVRNEHVHRVTHKPVPPTASGNLRNTATSTNSQSGDGAKKLTIEQRLLNLEILVADLVPRLRRHGIHMTLPGAPDVATGITGGPATPEVPPAVATDPAIPAAAPATENAPATPAAG